MKKILYILLFVLAVVWALTLPIENTIGITSLYVFLNGVRLAILALLICGIYSQYQQSEGLPGLSFGRYFVTGSGILIISMLIFFLTLLLGNYTGFFLLSTIMTWLCDNVVGKLIAAALIALVLQFLIFKIGRFIVMGYYWVINHPVASIGFVIAIILFFLALSSNISLPKTENPFKAKEEAHTRTRDSIAAVERAQELAKKAARDAAAAKTAQDALLAANQATGPVADNGAHRDQGDPRPVQTITTEDVVLVNSGKVQSITELSSDQTIEQPVHNN